MNLCNYFRGVTQGDVRPCGLREIAMRQFPHDELNISIVIDLGLINQIQTIEGNEETMGGVTHVFIFECDASCTIVNFWKKGVALDSSFCFTFI